jgi:hypothetical protein
MAILVLICLELNRAGLVNPIGKFLIAAPAESAPGPDDGEGDDVV